MHGRTDALGAAGVDKAIRRANMYREAGADLAFIDGVKKLKDVDAISKRLEGPKVLAIVTGVHELRQDRPPSATR